MLGEYTEQEALRCAAQISQRTCLPSRSAFASRNAPEFSAYRHARWIGGKTAFSLSAPAPRRKPCRRGVMMLPLKTARRNEP